MRILLAAAASLFMILIAHGATAHATSHPEKCELQSEGIYNGSWVRHRISVDENVIYGADDMEQITAQLEVLRGEGFCR